MSQVIGLIEIESEKQQSFDLSPDAADATLEDLFAQLVGRPMVERFDVAYDDATPTLLITANLDSLTNDLEMATRDVLAEIFLTSGRR
jgi:hypothetical protein